MFYLRNELTFEYVARLENKHTEKSLFARIRTNGYIKNGYIFLIFYCQKVRILFIFICIIVYKTIDKRIKI